LGGDIAGQKFITEVIQMSHSHQELFYHLIWGTKYHQPLISDQLKPLLLDFLKAKALALECEVLALNCVSDHVHMLLFIPAKLAVASAFHGLKGASSHQFKELKWQQGYGVFTLRRSDLPIVQQYIQNQEKHHQEGSINPEWELAPDTN
jgi:putative transposase